MPTGARHRKTNFRGRATLIGCQRLSLLTMPYRQRTLTIKTRRDGSQVLTRMRPRAHRGQLPTPCSYCGGRMGAHSENCPRRGPTDRDVMAQLRNITRDPGGRASARVSMPSLLPDVGWTETQPSQTANEEALERVRTRLREVLRTLDGKLRQRAEISGFSGVGLTLSQANAQRQLKQEIALLLVERDQLRARINALRQTE